MYEEFQHAVLKIFFLNNKQTFRKKTVSRINIFSNGSFLLWNCIDFNPLMEEEKEVIAVSAHNVRICSVFLDRETTSIQGTVFAFFDE